jgi:lantibiotic modifying enzyme
MLFDPARHEALGDLAWNEVVARAAIRDIVDDAVQTLGSGSTWPWHPRDTTDTVEPPHKSLYLGAAGVLWALWYLAREGATDVQLEWDDLIERTRVEYLDEPDTNEIVPSYFMGEAGILLVHFRITGSVRIAQRLRDAIRENIANPTHEALWGAPGTMIAALRMHEWTGDPAWAALFLENVEQLWRTWLPTEHGRIWTQDLYGEICQLLGAGHGFAGNAYPLLEGAHLLSAERREALYDGCVETLERTAITEGDEVNWPPGVGTPREGRTKVLLQWCHGAPGIVTAFGDFPHGRSRAMEQMLVRAGNLIWRAGPLEKGFGLCHGTAGNGYAFLKLHRRTGDPAWLERARRFGMHAILQAEAMREAYGHRRHTLWTGDAGLAVYLWHCIEGEDAVPTLDGL